MRSSHFNRGYYETKGLVFHFAFWEKNDDIMVFETKTILHTKHLIISNQKSFMSYTRFQQQNVEKFKWNVFRGHGIALQIII